LKKKTTLCLLSSGLLIIVIVLAACGRTSASGDRIKTIPHSVGWGFTNCLVCHSGNLAPPVIFHPTNPTNEECQNPGCHSVATPTQTRITLAKTTKPPATTTTPPVTTTTPPGTTTAPPTTTTEPPTTTTPAGETPQPPAENHSLYKDASSCFICHTGAAPVLAVPESHTDYENDSCLDTDCHVLPE